MDAIGHYLGKQPLVEVPSNFKKLLVEAAEAASPVEKAICIAYNMDILGMSKEETMPTVFGAANWLDDESKHMVIGRKIVHHNDFPVGKLGNSPLIHYGTKGNEPTPNYYDGADDKTPKTDLHGGPANMNISLKQQGAQLCSPKANEASGILLIALEHLNYSQPSVVMEGVNGAFQLIEKDMYENHSNRLYVKVGAGKTAFDKWYQTPANPRYDEVKRQAPKATDKQIRAHLKKELALGGGSRKATGKNLMKGIIDGVNTPSEQDIIDYADHFTWTKIEADNAMISAKHQELRLRNGAKPEDFLPDALAEQIKWIVESSIKQSGWQKELADFFETNQELKKWLVYEAASGEGKFTENARTGGGICTTHRSVANQMMVYTDSGGMAGKMVDIWKYSKDNADKVVASLNISFKGSGSNYYAKMGMHSEGVGRKKSSLAEKLELDTIMKEEYGKMVSEVISEGFDFTKWIKKLGSGIMSFIKKFYNKVVKRVVLKLTEWAKKGLKYFLGMLGCEISGKLKFGTV